LVKGARIFPKIRSHCKILGPRRVTRSKFLTGDGRISDNVQNLVAPMCYFMSIGYATDVSKAPRSFVTPLTVSKLTPCSLILSLIVLHHITPSQPLHRLTAQPSGPCELYTTWFLYCTTPFVHSKNKGQGTKNPSHAAHHVPQTPTTPDEDITSHITDTLLEREHTHRVTLPDN